MQYLTMQWGGPLSIKTGIQFTAKIQRGGFAPLSIVEWYL